MESRLPKLTGLRRPGTVVPVQKTILPTERLKSNATILKNHNSRFQIYNNQCPLTRDPLNVPFSSTRRKYNC